MRVRTSAVSLFVLLAATLFTAAPAALRGQSSPPAAQSAPSQSAPAAIPSPTLPESQAPLDVDHDPILSPDALDNAGVSPSRPNPTQEIRRNQQGIYTLQKNVDEVVLNCTVIDANGHLVQDLARTDFTVFEDNTPQQIVAFSHSDVPVSMGILVDNSGSMRDKRAAVNTAALDLVRASNPSDEAFVVNFSDEAFLDQDFTSDINKLRLGLSHIESRGGTALYDAVVASADQLSHGARRSKQVLIIVTDGEDNASTLNLEQTIRRVQDLQGPVVYSIGLLFGDDSRGQEARRARRALQLLSDETGGLAFFPHSLTDVDEIAAEVAQDIRNQYTIGYHSSKPASLGGYRTIRVDAHGAHHGKLYVRTRTGYYPKPRSQPVKNSVAESQSRTPQ
ncbi:MAG TPA: VWA domain-containing protein [Acidobacteriaceae bacterium]|jgi:VWFA-related protein|nr:VWA domain-containing protein [Acidobacteriaceae bacterium]